MSEERAFAAPGGGSGRSGATRTSLRQYGQMTVSSGTSSAQYGQRISDSLEEVRTSTEVKSIELRRHAERAKGADALSPEGRVQAEDVGRTLHTDYTFVFISPARRAAETVAWFLRASRQQLPPHAVVPDLASDLEDRWRAASKAAGSPRLDAIMTGDPGLVAEESGRLAAAVRQLFERLSDGGRALAVGHTPLIEAAVYGLMNIVVEPLGTCEGVLLTLDDAGELRLEELRLP
jgi:broad specificity phosphatase PhoE